MKINREKIEIQMARRKINTAELAESIGMKRQQLYLILSRGSCSPATVGKIASGLNVDVDEIIRKEVYV